MTYHYPDPFDRWRYSPYNPQNNDLVDREARPPVQFNHDTHALDSFSAWINERALHDFRRSLGQPGSYGKIDPPNSEPTVSYCPHCHRAIGGDRWAWSGGAPVREDGYDYQRTQSANTTSAFKLQMNCDCDICRGVCEDAAGV